MPAAQTAIRWVAHPLTIAAALVLLVNDHVLKAAFPGLVTGKLSDFAGLAAAPALVGLAVGLVAPRLPASVLAAVSLAATGAGFTWVKASTAGAEAASAAWSAVSGPSVVLADPADLLALPALALAWWAWRRARSAAPMPGSTVVRARLFVALPLVVLATAATSAVPVDTVLAVEDENGATAVHTSGGVTYGTPGGDWSRLDGGEWDSPGHVAPEEAAEALQNSTACVPDAPAHCYRLHEGDALGVDETLDGGASWRVSWEIPPERWTWLAAQHGLREYNRDLLTATDILVRTVPGGHQVVVAAGVEGLVVRSPDGTWERVPVDALGEQSTLWRFHAGPLPLGRFGHGVRTELGFALLAGALAMLIGTALLAGRSRDGITRLWAGVSGGLLVIAVPLLGFAAFIERAAAVALLAVAVIIVHTSFALHGGALPRRRALGLLGAALLPSFGLAVPYLGWTVGTPAGYSTASQIAIASTIAGSALFVLVTVRLFKKTSPGPRPRGRGRW